MTFGLKPAQQFTDVATLREIWAIADQARFDGLWTFDHFAPMGPVRTGDIFEAWTLLAAMAEATRHVRIGCLVSGNTNRHPAVLAKMATTIDHLSGGRLDVGLGAGGDELADTMLGLPTPPARERVERLAEACTVLDLLWTRPVADFSGTHYRLTAATSAPKPVQPPKPPLWLGSNGERLGLRVVAEHADVWLNASLPGTPVEELTRLSGVLDRHCATIGRDPATVRRAVQFRLSAEDDDTVREARTYLDAGFTDLVLMLPSAGDTVGRAKQAAALLPRLRELGRTGEDGRSGRSR
ncbi:LLM class flavin-dependent oxidoreductase [Amycolatopsis sp. NPDC023774]|uniref:LLM class flavin-dependent oxidoreductase n=1 Tax=Amycolatopsis sp. NPDC023774 TaxID=3155015 RepID=UPI00340A3827